MQTLKKTRRKHKTNRKKHTKQQKNLKENRNNRNTGYPALDPTANRYLSGSGWDIYVVSLFCYVSFLIFLFSFEFLCFLFFKKMCLYVFVRLSMQNLKKTRRKHKKKQSERNIKQNIKAQTNITTTEIQDIQPTNLRE